MPPRMLDVEPKGYEFKHAHRISLDGYRGVGHDLMHLNDPVADGFMRVSDMRSDIVVTQKPQDRALDYDEIGFVRVGKFLNLPRMELWHGDGIVDIKKEDDIWLVAINDQALANKVARSNDGRRKFDDLFIEDFRDALIRGSIQCLKNEKILNNGRYNLSTLTSYVYLTYSSLSWLLKKLGGKYYTRR